MCVRACVCMCVCMRVCMCVCVCVCVCEREREMLSLTDAAAVIGNPKPSSCWDLSLLLRHFLPSCSFLSTLTKIPLSMQGPLTSLFFSGQKEVAGSGEGAGAIWEVL